MWGGGAVLSGEQGQGERLQDLLVFENDTGVQVKPREHTSPCWSCKYQQERPESSTEMPEGS